MPRVNGPQTARIRRITQMVGALYLVFFALLSVTTSLVAAEEAPGQLWDSGQPERIVELSSVIKVSRNVGITVTEKLVVEARGHRISCGVYRSIPTRMEDALSLSHVVHETVLKVLLDGKPCPHHDEETPDHLRLFLGSSETRLSPGRHEFSLIYRLTDRSGSGYHNDWLWWNVSGGCELPIDRLYCAISPPDGAEKCSLSSSDDTVDARSGRAVISQSVQGGRSVVFRSNMPIPRDLKLTARVSWRAPSTGDVPSFTRLAATARDNPSSVIIVLGLIVLVLYYVLAPRAAARTAQGIPSVLDAPPDGMSPGSMCFFHGGMGGEKVIAATVLDMARKGLLSVSENEGVYTLTRLEGPRASLTEDEAIIDSQFFHEGKRIRLVQSNWAAICDARESLDRSLNSRCQGRYGSKNRCTSPGIKITATVLISALLAVAAEHGSSVGVAFAYLFVVTMMSFFVFVVAGGAVAQCLEFGLLPKLRPARKELFGGCGVLILILAIGLPLSISFAGACRQESIELPFVLGCPLLLWTNVPFYWRCRVFTPEGAEMRARVAAFRRYLKSPGQLADTSTGCTNRCIEYWPYAFALGVEDAWTKHGGELHHLPWCMSGNGKSANIQEAARALQLALAEIIQKSDSQVRR